MATRKVPAFDIVTDYTQVEENSLADTLTGMPDGQAKIYNTTLNKIRIWNGTEFATTPMLNPDGGTWGGGSAYDGNPNTITQDATHRFATDTEKGVWNGKQNALGFTPAIDNHTHAGVYEPANSNIQSFIGGGNKGYVINVQALTSSPVDAQTIYFGMLPKAPVTAQGTSKIYIRSAGIIKRAEIYCFSGTAGTNEAWPIYIRLNNSGDTLIQSLSVSTSERVFSNTGLNIAVVAGDYIEIKSINPTWVTNPLTCIFGGYIYIE